MSNLGSTLPSVTGYDHVGDTAPSDPVVGTTWWDTSVPTGKVWTGSTWSEEAAPAAGDGLTQSGGQFDVAVGDGLATSNGSMVAALGSGLGVDADGNVYVPVDAIGPAMVALGNALQGDGNGNVAVAEGSINHSNLSGAGTSDAHHSRYTDAEARDATHSRPGSTGSDGKDASSSWLRLATESMPYGSSVDVDYVAAKAERVSITKSTSAKMTVYTQDGNSYTESDSDGTGNRLVVNIYGRWIDYIYLENTDTQDDNYQIEIEQIATDSHSHNI